MPMNVYDFKLDGPLSDTYIESTLTKQVINTHHIQWQKDSNRVFPIIDQLMEIFGLQLSSSKIKENA